MEFIYKDKKYSWDEWHDEKRKFVDNLELPNDFDLTSTSYFSVIHDVGYTIGMNKYTELSHLIASARTALLKSFDKFYQSNDIKWGSPYEAHIWMRSEYLKNSIIWYNSCEDYIYQAIWFAFDMNKQEIDSPEKFEMLLKKVSVKEVKKNLKRVDTKNSKQLLSYINDYREHKDVKYMREQLANSLKHRGNISFNEINVSSIMPYERVGEGKKIKFSTEWIQPRVIDIDETIELMSRIHNLLITFARNIKTFINFDEMFVKDEDGVIIITEVKDKKNYKKV